MANPPVGRRIINPSAPPVVSGLPTAINQAVGPYTGGALTIAEINKIGGPQLQRSSATASKITSAATMGDIDALGKNLGSLMDVAREYDPSKWNKGLLGKILRLGAKQLDTKFKTIDQNVDTLVKTCNSQLQLFIQRIGDIDVLYKENEDDYYEFGRLAAELEAYVEWAEANRPQVDPNDAFSAQRVADWDQMVLFARKRADDMTRQQSLCLMQAPQLKETASGSFLLAQKFEQVTTITLPLMRKLYANYVIQMEQKKGAALATAIDAETNALLVANATAQRQNAVAIHNALSTSTIKVETLKHINDELMGGLQDIRQIQDGMLTRLKTEAPQIAQLNQQLLTHQAGAPN